MTKQEAERKLRQLIEVADLPVRPSYTPGEVQTLIGVKSEKTLRRMIVEHEVDPETGQPKKPYTLASITLRNERRITFPDLVDWLLRNSTYERLYS